eukprot:5563485-Prymnesium_polylepis.1
MARRRHAGRVACVCALAGGRMGHMDGCHVGGWMPHGSALTDCVWYKRAMCTHRSPVDFRSERSGVCGRLGLEMRWGAVRGAVCVRERTRLCVMVAGAQDRDRSGSCAYTCKYRSTYCGSRHVLRALADVVQP